MTFRVSTAIFAVFLCATGAAGTSAAAPSFDCRKAQSDSEKAICKDPALGQLDVEINKAYSLAIMQLDANGKKKLKADQGAFIAARDEGLGAPDYDLAMQMTMRRDFLRSIREAKGKWTGNWANAYGTVSIKQVAGGYEVRASSAEPTRGRWVCEFDDAATASGSLLTVGAASAKLEAGGPNEGWMLALKMVGDVMELGMVRPKGWTAPTPFCGNNGTLEGTYFAENR